MKANLRRLDSPEYMLVIAICAVVASLCSCAANVVFAVAKPAVVDEALDAVGAFANADVVIAGGNIYTGSEVEPAVVVTLNGGALLEGVDYELTYSNNVNAGTASVRIAGLGVYTGSFKVATFAIGRLPLTSAKISLSQTTFYYNGAAQRPEVVVMLGNKTLKQDADYKVTYSDNIRPGTASVTISGVDPNDEAEEDVLASCVGNYSGYASAHFSILNQIQMMRLYNPYTGEHFYTADKGEVESCVAAGWKDEGGAWVAPSRSSRPVYRLYNSYVPGGDHHYTADEKEVEACEAAGWTYEGVGWYSDDAEGAAVYRAYNPYAATGTHHYTVDASEIKTVVDAGWMDEGIAWYGMK